MNNPKQLWRLTKMLRLLLAQDAFLPPDFSHAAWHIRTARRLFILGAPRFSTTTRGRDLASRIAALGPSYIKLGQFLATRGDIIGEALAQDLAQLQDRLPPFSDAEVARALEDALGTPQDYLANISAPIAAASIAQVHQAFPPKTAQKNAPETAVKKYAVKILRPHIERILMAELASFMSVARFCEKFVPRTRRLRPVAIVATIQHSMAQEVDLRMEAAALSEMASNIAQNNTAPDSNGVYANKDVNASTFRVPQVIWHASRRRVLVMEWIDGIPIAAHAQLTADGHDLKVLATRLIRVFLTLALRDGFFHADMHQGNLLVAKDGALVGIDLGITGRLDADSRRFLAEILYGFIERDYKRIAQVHFEAGYVSQPTSDDKDSPNMGHDNSNQIEEFAQALRAIGEPIRDRNAADISMAHLLAQLFEVTAQFNMPTQPQLLLLQKTMVNVEGVARALDPQLNFWEASAPVVEKWLKAELGAPATLRMVADTAKQTLARLRHLPQNLDKLERSAEALHMLAQDAHRRQQHRQQQARSYFFGVSRRFIVWFIIIAAVIGLFYGVDFSAINYIFLW